MRGGRGNHTRPAQGGERDRLRVAHKRLQKERRGVNGPFLAAQSYLNRGEVVQKRQAGSGGSHIVAASVSRVFCNF